MINGLGGLMVKEPCVGTHGISREGKGWRSLVSGTGRPGKIVTLSEEITVYKQYQRFFFFFQRSFLEYNVPYQDGTLNTEIQ